MSISDMRILLGHPFAVGVTLAKLAAFTVDEKGNETFDTSGALDKLRKSLQLERLAMYHDSNQPPWNMDKKWEDLSPKDWVEIFEDGINEPAKGHKIPEWAQDSSYLVSPINGVLKYHRLGNSERTNPEMPFEEAHLILGDVSLTLTEVTDVSPSVDEQALAFLEAQDHLSKGASLKWPQLVLEVSVLGLGPVKTTVGPRSTFSQMP